MCGICGVLAPAPLDRETVRVRLRAMVAMIRHRGPDGEGAWSDGRAGLGHARLAVIDLGPEAAQPMSDAEGRVHIVHNGEIYNFQALRDELIALGHRFRSHGDTEVIVNGYRQWGEGVIERLRGMFAFAIWDAPRQRLILARDRLGQKPLYYMRHDGAFLFGSEIKAVLAWPGVARRADPVAIDRYLGRQYVPGPGTAFVGIQRLEPAHYMVIEADGRTRATRYWRLPTPDQARPRPLAALREELLARLDEAVRLRLISDVPLGAFLSGGVDSAAVVAAMARAGTSPVKTFTIGFAEDGYDERPHARRVAEHLGTEHREALVAADAMAVLPKLVWHYGEPFADSSAVPTWYVAEMTRRQVTVALNGDGGDEAFLGYPRYQGCRLGAMLDAWPRSFRQAAAAVGRALPFAASAHRGRRYLRRFLVDAGLPGPERYRRWTAFFTDDDKRALYGDGLAIGAEDPPAIAPGGAFDEAAAAYLDIHGYLPDDLLVKVDVATMAHGLEARAPFLDHELMAFAATIPAARKMRLRETKALLKAAVATRVPPETVYRPKMGFNVPIDRWLRDELRDFAYDTLTATRATARGLFRPAAVRALLDDHVAGRGRHQDRIWALLMLELWFVMWIDPPTLAGRP